MFEYANAVTRHPLGHSLLTVVHPNLPFLVRLISDHGTHTRLALSVYRVLTRAAEDRQSGEFVLLFFGHADGI